MRTILTFTSFVLLTAFGGVLDGPGQHEGRLTGVSFPAAAPPPGGSYTGTCADLDDIAAMPEGTWCILDAPSLSDVPPVPLPRGAQGQKSVVYQWCGAAHDTLRNRFLISCGGHDAYAGNEIYALDFDTPENGWSIIWGPSDDADIPLCDVSKCLEYDDGAMSSRHTYNGIIYDPLNDNLLFYGGSPYYLPGGTSGDVWKFDLSSPGWTRLADPFTGGAATIAPKLWDPDKQEVMVVRAKDYEIKLHNTTADSYSNTGATWAVTTAHYTTVYYDTVRDLVIAIGGGAIYEIDTTGGTFTALTTTNCTTPANMGAPGAVWYPPEQLGVIYEADTNDTTVWVFDYPTLTCTEIPVSSENLATLFDVPVSFTNGTYTRWQYIPSIDRLVAISSIDETLRIYRMPDHYTIQAANPNNVIAYSFEVGEAIAYDTTSPQAGIFINGFQDRTGHVEITDQTSVAGDQALRFIVASETGAGAEGQFYAKFSDDYSVSFGEGEGFYVQWRQKFSTDFLTTQFDTVNPGRGGWKQIIIGEADRDGYLATACTNEQIVLQNTNQRGFVQGYDHCPPINIFEYSLGGGNQDYHHPGGVCDRTKYDNNWWTDAAPDCFKFTADEWMTFEVYIEVGTWAAPDSTVRIWAAGEGDAPTLVMDMSPGTSGPRTLTQETAGVSEYGKVWLLPYHTGKDPAQVHSVGYVDYDGLLVSTSPIPFPGGYPLP